MSTKTEHKREKKPHFLQTCILSNGQQWASLLVAEVGVQQYENGGEKWPNQSWFISSMSTNSTASFTSCLIQHGAHLVNYSFTYSTTDKAWYAIGHALSQLLGQIHFLKTLHQWRMNVTTSSLHVTKQ